TGARKTADETIQLQAFVVETEREGQAVCACGEELHRTDSPAVAIVRHRRREKRKVDMR
ncbi:MAG: hypothetical protein RJA29_1502, partial [Pseudomonadota bacterium]